MNKRLTIKNLKVQSFITSINVNEKMTIEGMEDVYIVSRIKCAVKKLKKFLKDTDNVPNSLPTPKCYQESLKKSCAEVHPMCVLETPIVPCPLRIKT